MFFCIDLYLYQYTGEETTLLASYMSHASGIRHNPYSMPNLPSIKKTCRLHEEGGLAGNATLMSLDNLGSSVTSTNGRRVQVIYCYTPTLYTRQCSFVTYLCVLKDVSTPVSAVNMKTGQPVFSLDVQVSNMTVGSRSKARKSAVQPRTRSAKLDRLYDNRQISATNDTTAQVHLIFLL